MNFIVKEQSRGLSNIRTRVVFILKVSQLPPSVRVSIIIISSSIVLSGAPIGPIEACSRD
jgi:hypothetical protein